MVPKGRKQRVLADAPEEWAHLQRRRDRLLASLETPVPVVVAAAPTPVPTATPFSVRLPERPAPPPTEAPSVAAVPRTAPAPTEVPLPPGALALREDLATLLSDPSASAGAGETLRPRLARLESAFRRGGAADATVEKAVRRELAGEAGAPAPRERLERPRPVPSPG